MVDVYDGFIEKINKEEYVFQPPILSVRSKVRLRATQPKIEVTICYPNLWDCPNFAETAHLKRATLTCYFSSQSENSEYFSSPRPDHYRFILGYFHPGAGYKLCGSFPSPPVLQIELQRSLTLLFSFLGFFLLSKKVNG